MAEVEVKYRNAVIAGMNASGTKTLKTNGKYCNSNIEVKYTRPSGGGGVIESLNITENGTYTPSEGIDGYAPVIVNVQSSGRLPNEYQEVEYIESTGTQYINLAFQFGTIPKRVVFDFRYTQANSNTWLFGTYNGGINVVEAGIYSNSFYTGAKFSYSTTTRTNRCIAISQYISTISDDCYLFARNLSGDLGYCSARIYWLRIDKEEAVIMNLVPCYRKSDDEPGMYDIISGTFFVNVGSGSFICGPAM